MLRRLSFVMTGIVMALLWMPCAHAELIDVQFSGTWSYSCGGPYCSDINPPQSGAAVAGATGDQWNDFATDNTSDQALVAVNGAATGVTLGFSATGTYTAATDYDAFTGTPWANLMEGYLVNNVQILLSGLVPGQTYDFYVYTQGDDNSAGRGVTFDVNGADPQTASQTNADNFILNNNYVYLQGVADVSGDIAINETGDSGEADVNGFQLVGVNVPEPSALGILAAGLLALGMLRRDRLFGRAGQQGQSRNL